MASSNLTPFQPAPDRIAFGATRFWAFFPWDTEAGGGLPPETSNAVFESDDNWVWEDDDNAIWES